MISATGYLSIGCNNTASLSEADKAYVAGIIAEREQKDLQFGSDKNGPFSDTGHKFKGLNYYPAEVSWQKKAEFVPGKIKPLEVLDSKGKMRKYYTPGTLQFFHNRVKYQVPVLIEDRYPNLFFIMFRDKTNGKETYGGGRYIEMEASVNQKEYFLDFNKAFNPYCHYNKKYSCPIVPKEALLDFEVTAGEKSYSEQDH